MWVNCLPTFPTFPNNGDPGPCPKQLRIQGIEAGKQAIPQWGNSAGRGTTSIGIAYVWCIVQYKSYQSLKY